MSLFDRLQSMYGTLIVVFRTVGPLVGRLVIGYAFTQTGLGKLRHFDNTVQFFEGLGIPAPVLNAGFVATLELVGGWALIVGLGTRLFSLLLSSTMVVALLTADRASLIGALTGTSQQALTDVTPIPFLTVLLLLVATGSGTLGLDRFFHRSELHQDPLLRRRVA
jgi:putative oxidoreductase